MFVEKQNLTVVDILQNVTSVQSTPGVLYNSMIICLHSAFVMMTHMARDRLIWDTLQNF